MASNPNNTNSNSGQKVVLPEKHISLLKGKNYTIGKVLNSGKYSRVCTATMNQNHKPTEIAVKVIDLTLTSDDYRMKFLPKELNALTILKHQYIILVHTIVLIDNTVYVFMEKAAGGDILDMLAASGSIPEAKAKVLYKGIAQALKYIHSQGYAHRDVKSENILLNKERTIAKITDFGFSTTCFDPSTGRRRLSETYCGSPYYSAPEVLKAEPYDPMKSDVWSLGVVLYVMVNNFQPFTQQSVQKMSKQTTKQFSLEFQNKNLSKDCKDLISKQIELDRHKRLSMDQVVEHKWLKTSKM